MTLLKNMFLIAAFSLSMPFTTFTRHTVVEIDLNHEINTINSFMPILRQQTTIGAEKVVQWLEIELQKPSFSQYDAISITNILKSNATINIKVANILEIITIKESEQAHLAQIATNKKRNDFINAMLISGFAVFCGALILIDAATNPYTFREPDSITTTYHYGSHSRSVTSYWPYDGCTYNSCNCNPTPNVRIRVKI